MTATYVGRATAKAPRSLAVRLLDKYFYFSMSLLVAAIVVFGFSHTVDQVLVHPAVPKPLLLWIHGGVFSLWVVFFIFQSALVRTGNVRVHRVTGWFGAALGVVIPVLGISTAIGMARFHAHRLHEANAGSFLLVPFLDICCFTSTFWLAVYWRRKPELHRRLVLIATCVLTAAAFGRLPTSMLSPIAFYPCVDVLILLGVARDLVVNRRVHRVYLYALPPIAVVQFAVVYTVTTTPAWWVRIASAVVG
jgi:hypothetical protein